MTTNTSQGDSCSGSRGSQTAPGPVSTGGASRVSTFSAPWMDCPSEENLIRMVLADASGVGALTFDLKARELTVAHEGEPDAVLPRLVPLNLGARVLESTERAGSVLSPDPEGDAAEARTLKLLLGINGAMFVFEMAVGVMAQSTGLIADSLDVFADAAV